MLARSTRRCSAICAHPHRFRDTLAVDLLASGASPYDVAKMLGGLGACGMETRCCSRFLTEFSPISIKMAKEQGISLTPTEYDLLRALIQHPGRVLTHRQLLQKVWGNAYETETHLLRVNVSNLRAKLEADASRPQLILTEPGVGYRLKSL